RVDIDYAQGTRVSTDFYSASSHAGTHMDAPSHFYPGAATIDQLPLDQLTGPAAVIDITERAATDRNAEMTVADLIHWEQETGQTLNDTIVLMRSGYGKCYSNKELYTGTVEDDITKTRFPGVSPEAALFMVTNRRVKGAGVDTLCFDRGLTKDYLSHQIFLGNGLFIMENVANLEKVPIYGATVYASPMKIRNAGGAPLRLVATYPNVDYKTNKLY
ncbi:hypothetical protein JTE90_004895, partial [Oedothorax gibbosus]